MKIAFFLAATPTTSETFIVQQIRNLADRGHRVTVLAAEQSAGESRPSLGSAQLNLFRREGRSTAGRMANIARYLFGAMWTRAGRRQLRVILRAAVRRNFAPMADFAGARTHLGRYDAVLAHFGPAGVRAMYLREAGLLSGSIATVFHGLDMSAEDVVRSNLPHYRRLFLQTEMCLPISRLWRERLVRWGAPPDKVKVLHMGVDLPPCEVLNRGKVHRTLRVLSVARLVEKKGLAYAVAGVAACSEPLQYSIAGYGPLEGVLRKQAQVSVNPVRFLGKLPHQEVLDHLNESDVFVLPSITARDGAMEGIPVSLMEAMARGVVVVSTRHAGIPELIEDGREGFLVEERDSAALARVLEQISRGAVSLDGVRCAARLKIEQEFNNAGLNDQLEQLLRQLSVLTNRNADRVRLDISHSRKRTRYWSSSRPLRSGRAERADPSFPKR